ncbi:glycine betaine transporter [Gillisia sp. Hel_I_86]|uniref:BCCT family transporter n=1 Tax=Gillisia sp. Hel_I_86 TaxID=1249981 RepID=UPI00119C141F|nr:BCCT family transporter [Gillisia sp. Hel_I_86]TVZ25727.1 glycine betaine transporter [Gillisia sp. Hel_I_86]
MKSLLSHFRKNLLLTVAAFVLFFVAVYIFLFTETFYALIENGSLWVREWFGGFYLWLGLICVVFLLVLAFTKVGKLRLGNAPPEFNRWSWIAMLYSAGMGAGILLRGVQEPVYMLLNPPIKTGQPNEIIALEYTFYQWGFTAWAFYAMFAILVGHSLFVKNRNIRLGTSLHYFKRVKFLPSGIDLLTILTTVAGLVAAIGLGTTQIEGGIGHLLDLGSGNLSLTLFLVFLICFIAFLSAWVGIDKGIKRLSNWNIYLTLLLLFFVFMQGDILLMLKNFLLATYHYIVDFVPLSLALGNYDPGKEFLTDWTYYYWAFWLAWAPFTGIFIARISKGRTIREIILGVLLIPSLGTFLWFSVFGTSAFNLIEQWGTYQNEFGNVFTSLFMFFSNYPLAIFANILTVILLISFLVTSVDSAIYVLSMFTSKGSEHPKRRYRLIWAILILIFSEAIIVLGNIKPDTNVLTAMQKFLIIGSLPFAFFTVIVMILLSRTLFKKV